LKSTVPGSKAIEELAAKELKFIDSGELSRKVAAIIAGLR
jgi:hypothetical protein